MNKIIREFVSDDSRQYKFKIGKTPASALSGFISGVIFTVIAILGTALAVYLFEIISSV